MTIRNGAYIPGDAPPGVLLLVGSIIAFGAALTALWLNGYPILIYDTVRYNPSREITTMASSLPHFLNTPFFQLFGANGAAIGGSLASAYGVARFSVSIARRLELNPVEAISLLVAICSFSLLPLYAIMIASEPYSIAFLCVVIASIVDRKLSWLDFVMAFATAATHASNILLVGFVLLWAVIIGLRPRLAHTLVLVVAVGGSMYADRVLYRQHGPAEERLALAYAGTQILSVFPFVLEDMCMGQPGFTLCQEPYRSHIAERLQINQDRRAPGEACGQHSGADYLWFSSTLLSRWGKSKLPPGAQLSNADLNRLSQDLLAGFLTSLPSHLPETMETVLCRLKVRPESPGLASNTTGMDPV